MRSKVQGHYVRIAWFVLQLQNQAYVSWQVSERDFMESSECGNKLIQLSLIT